MEKRTPEFSPLGKKSAYKDQYDPALLFPLPRATKRQEIGVPENLPFTGVDIWNAYEISWLNPRGKPLVAMARFIFPCESPYIIESKSFKLYLNAFNNSRFADAEAVQALLYQDLSDKTGAPAQVTLLPLHQPVGQNLQGFSGESLDALDISVDAYETAPHYLQVETDTPVTETLYSDLLKSNCLVTGQPDWGSVQIHYRGPKIQRQGLLKYIISFRNHNEFHEQCVERIFMDILRCCAPEQLTVYARYTRRGGLDINPFRSNIPGASAENFRMPRQ